MGVCVHYWAIPPNSRFYARLKSDRAFNALLACLFPYGCGIYRFSEIEPEERKGILDEVVEGNREVLGPEQQARQRITEFLAELAHTRADFPGIEGRTAMLEKCSSDIEERLTQAIRDVHTNTAEWIRKIMFGDQLLASHLCEPGEPVLGLVSLPVLREGAETLERLKPENLFPYGDGLGDWYRDNYRWWRQLYLEAAQHDEQILVGVS